MAAGGIGLEALGGAIGAFDEGVRAVGDGEPRLPREATTAADGLSALEPRVGVRLDALPAASPP